MKDLQLLALVGIVDPPRAEARDAIARAKDAGIKVRMITGDHAITAEAIARQLGLEGRAITGAEFAAWSDDEADKRIDEIGVIARVAPEDKVHLVDILRRKGDIVAMTGDGVNDAPALKRADIGVAMGITGTEVSKEAAVMILTDDNFATIVQAVEGGRALYDNLLRYIRFQMASLFGFIGTFLGASIFNILGGVPFLPLQTLWINFTVTVFQAVGLGYSEPRAGLMEEPPRPKDQRILPRPLFIWLVFVGLVFAAPTLAVIAWASQAFDEVVAHSMGLVTFSMFHLFFSLETADEERTIFSSQLLENGTLLKASGLSLLTIFLSTTFGPLQRMLDTTELTVQQWALCIVVAFSVVVIAEIRKFFRRRRAPAVEPPIQQPAVGQAGLLIVEARAGRSGAAMNRLAPGGASEGRGGSTRTRRRSTGRCSSRRSSPSSGRPMRSRSSSRFSLVISRRRVLARPRVGGSREPADPRADHSSQTWGRSRSARRRCSSPSSFPASCSACIAFAGVSTDLAIGLALAASLAQLFLWGLAVGRAAHGRWPVAIGLGLVDFGFGVAVVALKAVVLH